MNDWLVKHALENTWCKPSLDRRLIAKPTRLSASTGVYFGMTVNKISIQMPKADRWFHVFQLGKVAPERYSLRTANAWARLDRVINDAGTIITLYNEEGRVYPNSLAWIRKLPTGNLLIATEIYDQVPDFTNDALFIRIYDGHYSDVAGHLDEYKSEVYGDAIRNPEERTAMIFKFNTWRQDRPGHTLAYVNGNEVERLLETNVKLWDYVEIVYDGLVEDVHYIPVNGLESFTSDIDSVRKYLLHPTRQYDTIRFINDIDISIQYKDGSGRYYHQHHSMDLRQVTHCAYSIPTSRVQKYIDQIDDWHDSDDVTIKLMIRRSGLDRPVQFEMNRIHELYKLPLDRIKQALVGTNSTLPEWRAQYLENSKFNHIMAASYPNVTTELCTEAYGYNAVSKYAADNPVRTEETPMGWVAIAPPLLSKNSMAYEYDETGVLLGYYPCVNISNDVYIASHSQARLVEFVEGQGNFLFDIHYDAADFTVDPAYNYRFYLNEIVGDDNTAIYHDVTGDSDVYEIDGDGKVFWNYDPDRVRPVIVSDKYHLVSRRTGSLRDGVIEFDIEVGSGDGYEVMPSPFQFESLDIIFNGHTLTPGIDYQVKWPRIVINCKRFLQGDTSYDFPDIVVRCRGLTDKYRMPSHGFVTNGLLSNNCRFDVRDDKVVRIAVGGHLFHRDDLEFREDIAVGVNTELNGLPYYIDDATVPLRGLVSRNTYDMREESKELDKRVEDYLTVYYPTPPVSEDNMISSQYHIYSSLINKVVSDIVNGILTISHEGDYLSTQRFDELMLPYLYLLDYDPTRNGVDVRYVVIHPHAYPGIIEVTELAYSFIEKINDRLLGNKVTINNHLRIKA